MTSDIIDSGRVALFAETFHYIKDIFDPRQ